MPSPCRFGLCGTKASHGKLPVLILNDSEYLHLVARHGIEINHIIIAAESNFVFIAELFGLVILRNERKVRLHYLNPGRKVCSNSAASTVGKLRSV